MEKDIIPIGQIEKRIYVLRGKRVMLDADLADLYGVTTKRLNETGLPECRAFHRGFCV